MMFFVFFLKLFLTKSMKEKKKSDVLSGCRNRRIFVFRNSVIKNVTNVVLILHFCFCESLS